MKIVLIISSILIASVFGVLLFTGDKNTTSTTSLTNSFASVRADIDTGAQLLDVRTPEEFTAGYIEGASNYPLNKIQAGLEPTASKTTKVYVYCRSGNRSAEAKSILEKSGYADVVDLGAINEVVAMGGKQIN